MRDARGSSSGPAPLRLRLLIIITRAIVVPVSFLLFHVLACTMVPTAYMPCACRFPPSPHSFIASVSDSVSPKLTLRVKPLMATYSLAGCFTYCCMCCAYGAASCNLAFHKFSNPQCCPVLSL